MTYEKSLIIIKPDGVERGLIGAILQRFERCGMTIHAARFQQMTPAHSREHYAEHVDKPFYDSLERYMTSGPVLILVIGGWDGTIAKIRQMVGATAPAEALPGTIRGDFAFRPRVDISLVSVKNLVHASATPEEAERKIAIWFAPAEIIDR